MSYGWTGQSPHSQPQPGMSVPRQAPRPVATHPGWLARSLFWAAIIIGALPALIVVPLMSTGDPRIIGAFGISTLLAGILRLLLGTSAMLLVRNTTWTRRLIAGGIHLFACLIVLCLPPLIPMVVGQLPGDPSSSITVITAIQAVISTVFLALVFISWNVARNRGWRVLLASVLFVISVSGMETMAQAFLSIVRSSSPLPSLLIQVMSLALTFLGLGLFHLLAKLRSGSVASPPPQSPYGQWDSSPQNPYGQWSSPPQHQHSQPQTPPHYGGPRR